MLVAQISMLNYMGTMHLMSGIVPKAIGNGHFVHVPYNSFATSDGHIIVACIGDTFFERFVDVMDLPALRDPEYLKQPVRYAARQQIEEVIQAEMRKHSTAYWLDRLRSARIPCGPVNNFQQALNDTQVRARDMVVDVTLESGRKVSMPGNPMKLSASPQPDYSRPPAVGEHTRSVLEDLLGYSQDKIGQLRETGAIG
jgi:crotonobetainyl-CoA:carnitine CoA-transferase CaiB-like acyl-CoA transferase